MTYNLGKFMLTPRGNYSSSANYYRLDFVLYQGSSYVCKGDNISGILPTNTSYWQKLAAAGEAYMTEAQRQQIVQDLLQTSGLVIDSSYNNFSTAEKQKLAALTQPNNGTLTIKVNNNTVQTFTADSSANKNVNLSIPYNITDLNNFEQAINVCFGFPIDVQSEGGCFHIEKLEANTFYFSANIQPTDFKCDYYAYDDVMEKMMLQFPSYIYFSPDADITTPSFPSSSAGNYKIMCPNWDGTFQTGKTYLITVKGNTWRVDMIEVF